MDQWLDKGVNYWVSHVESLAIKLILTDGSVYGWLGEWVRSCNLFLLADL